MQHFSNHKQRHRTYITKAACFLLFVQQVTQGNVYVLSFCLFPVWFDFNLVSFDLHYFTTCLLCFAIRNGSSLQQIQIINLIHEKYFYAINARNKWTRHVRGKVLTLHQNIFFNMINKGAYFAAGSTSKLMFEWTYCKLFFHFYRLCKNTVF